MKAASLNTDVYNNEGKNSDKTADLVMFEVLSFVFFFLHVFIWIEKQAE